MHDPSFGQPNWAGLVILTGLLAWGATQTGPIVLYGNIRIIPAALAGLATLGALRVTFEALMGLARVMS